ncbi:hypothetical protein [Acinetobacter pittii]|uniref:hypothetical protein n=1 Tax=Acinetobacter pittii TaxID=48296 RepID=UPI003260651B
MISPEIEEELNILSNSELWLKNDEPDLYQSLKSLIEKKTPRSSNPKSNTLPYK